jgi:hypothetical protein
MKQTLKQRAEELGMTRDVLAKIRGKGVDIYDDEAVKAYRSTQRLRVRSDTTNAGAAGDETAMTIEDIDAIINNPASDYAQIRTAKERLASLTASQKLRREMAESFSADEVKARDTAIGAAMRMAMMRIETELPGRCEGLSATKMKGVMRAFTTQILTELADAQSPFWQAAEKAKQAGK